MLKKLRNKKKDLVGKMQAMNEASVADPESFVQEDYDSLKNDLSQLVASIDRLEDLQDYQESEEVPAAVVNSEPSNLVQNAIERNRAHVQSNTASQSGQGTQNGFGREDERNLRNFSIVGYLRDLTNQASSGKPVDGLTRELIQDAETQASSAGVTLEGFGIPQNVLSFNPRNDMTVGTAADGGNLVPTELTSVIDTLRERLQVRRLGATLLGGLSGDVEFPRMASGTEPDEKGENVVADEYTPSVSKFAMSPKRLPVFAEISKKLITQSSTDVESWMRNELAFRLASRIDQRAINGSGTGEIPRGIINTANVNSVAIGANGGAPTRDNLIDLETAIATDNADMDAMSFLTTPGVRGKLKKTLLDAGSGQFVWQQGSQELEGYNAAVSTNVPSNISKGTGVDLHAILFGVWSQLIIGQWGGLDIVINPFSRDTEGLIRITFTTFYDLGVRHPESFAVLTDADIA